MKTHLEQLMKELPFVTWDRFTKDGERYIAYGWIEREKDQYKDFMTIDVDPTGVSFVTSSPDYTHRIHTILFGNDAEANHDACQRVEDHFKINNMVCL